MNWGLWLVLAVQLAAFAHAYQQIDEGNGFLYRLETVKDTFLERNGRNYDRFSQ